MNLIARPGLAAYTLPPGGGDFPNPNIPPPPIAVTPGTTLTAAQAAQQNLDTAEAYRKEVELISSGPKYDFGRGADMRNKFYGGLGNNASGDGGLSFSAPGLGINIVADIEKGIMRSLPQVGTQAARDAQATLGIPDVQVPSWLNTIIGNVKNAVASDKPQALVPVAPAPIAPKSQAHGINWLYVGGGVAAAYILYRMVK